MSVTEKISRMSKTGSDDDVLMDYIQNNFDILECELNGDKYEEPKKHNRNFVQTVAWKCSLITKNRFWFAINCDQCNYYPVYVTLYNHTMKPLRRKCNSPYI